MLFDTKQEQGVGLLTYDWQNVIILVTTEPSRKENDYVAYE